MDPPRPDPQATREQPLRRARPVDSSLLPGPFRVPAVLPGVSSCDRGCFYDGNEGGEGMGGTCWPCLVRTRKEILERKTQPWGLWASLLSVFSVLPEI